jgi:DNA polymerase-3 subunit chi
MADIRFYHLTRKTAEQALPDLVRAAYGKGHKILVRGRDDVEVSRLNDFLWTHTPDSFLPHGSAKDNHAEKQPIFLTSGNDNPAGADVLMLMPGAATEGAESFAMCCQLLNGHDDTQIAAARDLWKTWKAAGHTITYWQQSEQGKWEQKA